MNILEKIERVLNEGKIEGVSTKTYTKATSEEKLESMQDDLEDSAEGIKTKLLKVKGVKSVTIKVNDDGVSGAKGSFTTTVKVSFDDEAQEKKIKDAIKAAGFKLEKE